MDRLEAMRTFRAVVEQGSFARAAAASRRSRSAVSKHVAQLEASLGLRLLDRTTRSVALSAVGRGYYPRVAALLDELDDAEREARADQTIVRGVLRVAVPMSLGVEVIAPAIPAFLREHPQLELDLQLSDRFIDVLEEGVDVAIRVTSRLEDSALVRTHLGHAPRVVVASPAYLERHGAPSTLAQLRRHRCLLYTRAARPDAWTFTVGARTVEVPVSGPLRADNSLALIRAARAGVGLILTPRYLVGDDLAAGRLVELPPTIAPTGHDVFALYPASRRYSAKARAFVELSRRLFATPRRAPRRRAGRRR